MDLSARLVGFYKSVRTTVQQGKLYRLQRPEGSGSANVEYVSQDGRQAVLFSYLHSAQYGMAQPRIHLEGLDPRARYRVRALEENKYIGEASVSGALLMGNGVALGMLGDYDSTALLLDRE